MASLTRPHTLLLIGILGLFAVPATGTAQNQPASAQADTTTASQKLEMTNAALAEMQDAVAKISGELEDAERKDDQIRAQCLSKKLTTMRTIVQVTEVAKSSMITNLDKGDNERAAHEFRKIQIALDRLRVYYSEAKTCLGNDQSKPGQTTIEVVQSGLLSEEPEEPMVDEEYQEPPDTSPY